MITNSELNNMGLATVDRTSMLPAARNIVGRTGKTLGTVQAFTATRSAKEIKLALKAKNPKMSGKALSAAVNEVLRGEVDMRQQLGVAWLQAAFSSGWTCDVGILRKNRGGLNLVKVKAEAPVAAPEVSAEDMAMLKALKESGMTIEEIKALLA